MEDVPETLPGVPVYSNISAYRFARMPELRPLRLRLLEFCNARNLKGTILLAPEGINLFVAGAHAAVEELVYELRRLPGLADLVPKYSKSESQPFSRMLVRLKKEIIAFGVEGIDPANYTSPRLKAGELKRWLDEGRQVLLFDTRNDYEVKLGTFEGAVPAGIQHFRDFPEAVAGLPEEAKKMPVVTFCTGGIRCEKAAPLMEKMGFEEVYQLEGGILKYFEEVGGSHYDGECFVFDQRVGLDPALRETGSAVCFACQTPLTAEEASDPRYVVGESCPYCYQSDETRRLEKMEERRWALRQVVSPLPGSQAYENRRPIRISADHNGRALIDVLDDLFPHATRQGWEELFDLGHVRSADGWPVEPGTVVKAGEEYVRVIPGMIEPKVNGDIDLVHEDEALVLINKPAPLPMHPCGRFNRNTLEYLLRQAWYPEVPRPAHRLDANTTGLVLCARSRRFAKMLQPQFENGEVDKTYLARVWGKPVEKSFVVNAAISREATKVGAREIDEENGQTATTTFRFLRELGDGTSLLEVRPLTGRTNQIRLHLWHVGLPIVGDPVYLRDGERGRVQTLAVNDPPMCLHAWRLGFIHPLTSERVDYEAAMPEWANPAENEAARPQGRALTARATR